jgi:GT2 family glycosyltransferase
MKNTKIDLSIIIVNYRCWEQLKDCLISLEKISLESLNFEVIIIDNLSQDGELRAFSKRFNKYEFILNSGNNGFAHACTLGANHSNGDFLMFLNPDTIMNEKALKTLITVAQTHSDYKLISCNKINAKGKYEKVDKPLPSLVTLFGFSRAIYKEIISSIPFNMISQGNKLTFPAWLSGSLVLTSKQWYKKIGGWNEDYWLYYEDVDLSKRTTDLQGQIVLIENVKIIHNHGGSTRANLRTKALTKSEVIISRHVYIRNNFEGFEKISAQVLLVLSVAIGKSLLCIMSLLLYFLPKSRVNISIFKHLMHYYFRALKNRTWLSQRSVNYQK